MRSDSRILRSFKMRRHYIVTRPSQVQELDLDDDDNFFEQLDYRLKDKARRLQLRRWRKIKYQLV